MTLVCARTAQLHRLLQDLPEELLEDSEAETEQDEEGEERVSTVSCSTLEGSAWSTCSQEAEGEGCVAGGVPPLQVEECDQTPHSGPWSAEGWVGVSHGPGDQVRGDARVHALESEMQSLTVLYRTRGKKLDEVSAALEAAVEEGKRCNRMHSHRQGELEAESAALRQELDRLRVSAVQMSEENASLSRQLEEAQCRAARAEEDRDEVCVSTHLMVLVFRGPALP